MAYSISAPEGSVPLIRTEPRLNDTTFPRPLHPRGKLIHQVCNDANEDSGAQSRMSF